MSDFEKVSMGVMGDIDYKKEVSEKDYLNDKDADPSCTWGIEILQIILKEFPDLEESNKVWIEW